MRKHEIRDGLRAAAAHDADEHTGGQKDQDHRHNILIADALCHDLQLVVKRQRPVLQAGDEDRGQKRHDDWNVVKAHFNFQAVFKQAAQPQIQNKEHPDGQQGNGARGFLLHKILSLLHKISPLAAYAARSLRISFFIVLAFCPFVK